MFNNQFNQDCGCENACQQAVPTYQQCNQIVQTCNVQEVPHYTCYHTHVINNCIKKHINIPVYSQSSENVYLDQYVEGMPIYQQPVMYNQNMMNGQMAYNPNQYQGNVSTEPLKQTPYQDYVAPNYFNPYSNM